MTIYRDPEKQLDTIARFVVHEGVRLESRYRKSHEFATMAAMVDAVIRQTDRPITKLLTTLYCDSKASATYTGWVPRSGEFGTSWTCEYLAQGALKFAGGYNWIELLRVSDDEMLAYYEPRWEFEEV
jgi:hypothetical protein